MPKKPKDLEKQLGFGYAGNSGEVFEVQEIGRETFKEMLKDETVSAAILYLTNAVLGFIGEYSHPDEKIAEFVRNNLENLDRDLSLIFHELLKNAFAYGWSAGEQVWRIEDGKILLDRIPVYDSYYLTLVAKDGELVEIKQQIRDKTAEIPLEKAIVFRVGNGVYGESFLRRVYRPWSIKKAFIKNWAIGVERFAMPTVWGRTPNVRVKDESGAETTSVKLLNKALANIHTQTSIATDDRTEISFLQPSIGGQHFSEVFKTAIEHLNVMIFRNFGLPNLLLGNTNQAGAYALGTVHYKMFQNVARNLADQLAKEFIDQVIYRLIVFNFGEQESYGEFTISDEPNPEERAQNAKVILDLINAGVLDPLADNKWIRAMLRLPEGEQK